ncbi:MAG: ATP-binding protein [Chloroflexota bacterium]
MAITLTNLGEVVVRLEMTAEETLALTVEDDGVGFRPPQTLSVLVQEQHFGLVGLEEQVEGVGGTIEVCSAPDAGCRLKAIVPVG